MLQCLTGCGSHGVESGCMPDGSRVRAVPRRTDASVCPAPSRFNSTRLFVSAPLSELPAEWLIARRLLTGWRKRIWNIIPDGGQDSEDNAEPDYSKDNENQDGPGEWFLTGRIGHEARSLRPYVSDFLALGYFAIGRMERLLRGIRPLRLSEPAAKKSCHADLVAPSLRGGVGQFGADSRTLRGTSP